MIALRARAVAADLKTLPGHKAWRITDARDRIEDRTARAALIADAHAPVPDGYDLYLTRAGVHPDLIGRNWIELPPELDYLEPDDLLATSPDGQRLSVLWRHTSHQNSILLTEQCDNYCLMCSQPPKQDDDSWLLERATQVIRLLPDDATNIIFTGGEPTLYGHRLIELLALCKTQRPETEIHILSNGRRFAQADFAQAYAAIDNPRMMVGIPIYGAEPTLHDFVVQARGAFEETVRGILHLVQLGQRVEIRVVIHKQTAPALVDIAEFIARNLPFVEQVALMGLEVMGLARANLADVWIDPFDYREALTEATLLLHNNGVRTLIYNHQLCLIEPRVWSFAVKSISDWKNDYDPVCESCAVVDRCGGFFHSAKYKTSNNIRPIDRHGLEAAIAAASRLA
jgi:His-Xaa-Ser system radical SAM maturase HxsC